MEKNLKHKLLPLVLLVVVIVVDQVTKSLVLRYLPLSEFQEVNIGPSFLGDFIRIIHVRNSGAAFSFGASWPLVLRKIVFVLLPIIVLGGVLYYYFKSNDFTKVQRWAITGIVGGGLGNLIDRIFRADGVVDFIDVKFFGIFGLERWPTFNVADSAVVVCGIMLVIALLVTVINESKNKKGN